MIAGNIRASEGGVRFEKWRGRREFLHAEPRQTIGSTHLVLKTRQSGVTK
jgi:hypothetical protein